MQEFENITSSTIDGKLTLSFDLKPSLQSLKEQLNDCSLVAVGSGPYVNGSFVSHINTPIFSSKCYRFLSVSNITANLSRNYSVDLQVTITVKVEWTADFNNRSSQAYQTFSNTVLKFVGRIVVRPIENLQ